MSTTGSQYWVLGGGSQESQSHPNKFKRGHKNLSLDLCSANTAPLWADGPGNTCNDL